MTAFCNPICNTKDMIIIFKAVNWRQINIYQVPKKDDGYIRSWSGVLYPQNCHTEHLGEEDKLRKLPRDERSWSKEGYAA